MLDSVKMRKADTETLDSCDVLKSAWSVYLDNDDKPCGYVASSGIKYTSPSTGKVRYPVQWGFAVHVDEFRSGIQFLYMNRTEALQAMLRTMV